ncbi:hypothetical protein SESBI_14315 [Sesbania bispinosa]|nr:hypothetical protein SESBI_14315 [Sesbania bispinosa]
MVTRRANGRQNEAEEATPQGGGKPGRKKDTFNSTHFASRQGRGFNVNEDRQKGTAWNEGRYKQRYQGPWSTGRVREVDLTPLNTSRTQKLIKDGFLGRYVERRRSRRGTRDEGGSSGRGNYNKRRREDNRRDEKEEPEEIRGVVTMIAGGFCGGGETSSAWRKYVRSVMSVSAGTSDKKQCKSLVISFSDEDMKGIKPHEDDPMVIDIVMAKYKVQRVLVDQGSSENILYWSTF